MISSLYVHIPFCKKKCDYCDFFSIGEDELLGKSNDLSDEYVESLVKEAEFYAELYGISEWKTIYVGGGTPSLLRPHQIQNLISGLNKTAKTDSDTEITFEVNPDDVSECFLSACKKVGVNRLSMGLQALDDKALQSVRRGSSEKIIIHALETIEKQWEGRLSVDFIAGLPNQTHKSFENQFEILEKYKKIDHVSLYTLTIEENTPLAKKIKSGEIHVSADKADKMWIKGRKILEKRGFFQYEISNFAKKGFESQHNSTYWKQENYVGIGSGASGTMYDFEKKRATRWTNSLSIPFYVARIKNLGKDEAFLPRTVENLGEKTLEFEFLMLGLRRLQGISEKEYEKRFQKSLAERIGANRSGGLFAQWEKNRLAKKISASGDTFYSLNRRGILLLNRFLEELL